MMIIKRLIFLACSIIIHLGINPKKGGRPPNDIIMIKKDKCDNLDKFLSIKEIEVKFTFTIK